MSDSDEQEIIFKKWLKARRAKEQRTVASFKETDVMLKYTARLVSTPVKFSIQVESPRKERWYFHGNFNSYETRAIALVEKIAMQNRSRFEELVPDSVARFYSPTVVTSSVSQALMWRVRTHDPDLDREFHVVKVPKEDQVALFAQARAANAPFWDLQIVDVGAKKLTDKIRSIFPAKLSMKSGGDT
jgi:hypothetical protein